MKTKIEKQINFDNDAYANNIQQYTDEIGDLSTELKSGQKMIVQHYIGDVTSIPWYAMVGTIVKTSKASIRVKIDKSQNTISNVNIDIIPKINKKVNALPDEISFRRRGDNTLLLQAHKTQANCTTFLTDYNNWRQHTNLAN